MVKLFSDAQREGKKCEVREKNEGGVGCGRYNTRNKRRHEGMMGRQRAGRQTRVRCIRERQETRVRCTRERHVRTFSTRCITPPRRRRMHESRISITFSNATVTPIAMVSLSVTLPTDCYTGTLQKTLFPTPLRSSRPRVLSNFSHLTSRDWTWASWDSTHMRVLSSAYN
mgnify:CR=1 FL=1